MHAIRIPCCRQCNVSSIVGSTYIRDFRGTTSVVLQLRQFDGKCSQSSFVLYFWSVEMYQTVARAFGCRSLLTALTRHQNETKVDTSVLRRQLPNECDFIAEICTMWTCDTDASWHQGRQKQRDPHSELKLCCCG
jgi:hypothetical protein